jgi:hypothetical protein
LHRRPDGAVYVADWCDPRATHVDSVDNWDKSNGRIYRFAHRSADILSATRANKRFDLAKLSSNELVDLLTNRNDWFRREARLILSERRDTNIVPRLRAQSVQVTNALLALQSLWALYVSGGFDDTFAAKLLAHSHTPMRAWTIRLLCDAKKISPELQKQIAVLAQNEKSATVRNQLACSAKRLAAADAMPIIRELLRHDEDVGDPQIPLLLWWAIEEKAISHRNETLTLLSSASEWDVAMMRAHILERLARRYAAEPDDASRQVCAWLLKTAMTREQRQIVLHGFEKAFEGQRTFTPSAELGRAFSGVWSREADDPLVLRIGLRFRQPEAQQRALDRLGDKTQSESNRLALIDTLAQCGIEPAVPALIGLLTERPKIQVAAISALQNFADPQIASTLIERHSSLSPEARVRARSALASRPAWARTLVSAVENGRVARRKSHSNSCARWAATTIRN